MNKLLPKTAKNPQGFTLIELMVAIAIVAILATIGLTIFLGTQKNARDTKRRSDLDAIAKAYETHFMPVGGICDGDKSGSGSTGSKISSPTYCGLMSSWFAGSAVPTDPSGGSSVYCVASNNTATTIKDPSGTSTGADCKGLTSTDGSTWMPVTETDPTQVPSPFNSWKVCTVLESSSTPLCIGSQQN